MVPSGKLKDNFGLKDEEFLMHFLKDAGMMQDKLLARLNESPTLARLKNFLDRHVKKYLRFHDEMGFETEETFGEAILKAAGLEDVLTPGQFILFDEISQYFKTEVSSKKEKKLNEDELNER